VNRLEYLSISGFRAFGRSAEFDLDADAIVVVGSNGQGKTSLFDAVLWILTGRLPRIGEAADSVVSLFSDSGEARGELRLRDSNGSTARIVRTSEGGISLERQGENFRGRPAEEAILRLLWPDALSAADPDSAFSLALERATYLQQDRVRDFLEADGDRERFLALSELMGAGRIVELQRALDRARMSWSRATNLKKEEAAGLRQRLESLQSRLPQAASEPQASQTLRSEWNAWWQDVNELLATNQPTPSPASPTASSALDSTLKQIEAQHRMLVRHMDSIRAVVEEIGRQPPPAEQRSAVTSRLSTEREALEETNGRLARAQVAAAAERERWVQLRDTEERMAAFAELALGLLTDRCPVCSQTYNRAETEQRLRAFIVQSSAPEQQSSDSIRTLASQVREIADRVAGLEAEARSLEAAERSWSASREEARHQSLTLGVDPSPEDSWTSRLLAATESDLTSVDSLELLRSRGEQLALEVARTSEWARREESQQALRGLQSELLDADKRLEGRDATGKMLSQLIDGLRDAVSDVVLRQLTELEPLLQRIYSSADPHPVFTVVRLLASMKGGRGGVATTVEDPLLQVSAKAPPVVLSSSQLNVLAVSVFLAINLGLARLPLRAVLLDDPLQSLDDVNLLGLVDLLRRTRDRRQLLISTHDDRFASLLERKLRPVSAEQRTVVIRLEGWSREGPTVDAHDVELERDPVRLAV
jgi:DNA repair exonuclease SbcCD ATPase subunit